MLAACPGVRLTALDPNPKRVERLLDTLKRTGGEGFSVHCADAEAGPGTGKKVSTILVDASQRNGDLRRQPDICLLRQPEELAKLSALQGALLAPSSQLKAGDACVLHLLRATGRREAVIAKFVAETPEARALSLPKASA